MPTVEQVFKVLRAELTDAELACMGQTISRILAAHDQVVATHVVNPVLVPKAAAEAPREVLA